VRRMADLLRESCRLLAYHSVYIIMTAVHAVPSMTTIACSAFGVHFIIRYDEHMYGGAWFTDLCGPVEPSLSSSLCDQVMSAAASMGWYTPMQTSSEVTTILQDSACHVARGLRRAQGHSIGTESNFDGFLKEFMENNLPQVCSLFVLIFLSDCVTQASGIKSDTHATGSPRRNTLADKWMKKETLQNDQEVLRTYVIDIITRTRNSIYVMDILARARNRCIMETKLKERLSSEKSVAISSVANENTSPPSETSTLADTLNARTMIGDGSVAKNSEAIFPVANKSYTASLSIKTVRQPDTIGGSAAKGHGSDTTPNHTNVIRRLSYGEQCPPNATKVGGRYAPTISHNAPTISHRHAKRRVSNMSYEEQCHWVANKQLSIYHQNDIDKVIDGLLIQTPSQLSHEEGRRRVMSIDKLPLSLPSTPVQKGDQCKKLDDDQVLSFMSPRPDSFPRV